jgi:hypothetical protein
MLAIFSFLAALLTYAPSTHATSPYLELVGARDVRRANCDPILAPPTTYCRNRIALLALTSPVYLR